MHERPVVSLNEFDEMSMNQLVSWHNIHCIDGDKVKSFRTKEIGKTRCKAMFTRIKEHEEFEEKTKDMTDEEFHRFAMAEIESNVKQQNPEVAASVKSAMEEATMKQDVHLRSVSLASPARSFHREVMRKNGPGVRESWKDPELHRRRTTRNHVYVHWDGKREEFRSVREAFEQLGLPMKSHIRFRGKLKIDGERTFTYEGEDYVFEVVSREEK